MDQKVALLATVPLLKGLDQHDLQRVAQLCDEVDLPAGRVVAKQGSYGSEFFVIISGTVSIDRDGQHLGDLHDGDFFGELALLGNIPRTATGTCATDARLLVLGGREFNTLLAQFPSIQSAVLHAVAQRITLAEQGKTH